MLQSFNVGGVLVVNGSRLAAQLAAAPVALNAQRTLLHALQVVAAQVEFDTKI